MKKTLSVVLAIVMLASMMLLTACGDTAGKYKVGVQSGTTGWSFMSGDADWGFAGFSNIEVLPFDNAGLAVTDMLNNNVDFVVVDDAPAASLVAANKGTKLIDIALTTEAYGIAVGKNDDAMLNAINTILAEKKADIDAIFAKYKDINDDNVATYEGETITSAAYDASKEQFVVATNAAFAPYEFKVGEAYAGIDMEISKLIADALGQELVIINMDFDAIVSSVGSNGVDAGIAAMTINENRKKVVNFSDPYETSAYQVIVCKEDCTLFDNCKTGEELIAVLNGLTK